MSSCPAAARPSAKSSATPTQPPSSPSTTTDMSRLCANTAWRCQRILMEIPAGKKDDPREDPLLCAKRELEEETGLRAERFELLTHARMSPGFLTECVSIYLATGLSQGKDHPDEDEYLNVVRMPLDEAVALVASGEIDDAKTIAGLLLARLALKKKEE